MLTLFTIPRAFEGDTAIRQMNALKSWRLSVPNAQILLLGDGPGIAEAAREVGAEHIPAVNRTEYGTPLLDDAFAKAEKAARFPLLCYINSDIILLPDFREAANRVSKLPRLLGIGSRWNVDMPGALDFSTPEWVESAKHQATQHGSLQQPWSSDYFLFQKGTLGNIPPFAVGRPAWDLWLIWHARCLKFSVVDMTDAVTAIHPNHDYQHVPAGSGNAWEGPEADHNRKLTGGIHHLYSMHDATHLLTPGGRLRPAFGWHHIRFRLIRMRQTLFPKRSEA